jgi:hypothetical protein
MPTVHSEVRGSSCGMVLCETGIRSAEKVRAFSPESPLIA